MMLLKCDFYKCVLEQTYIDSLSDLAPDLLTAPCMLIFHRSVTFLYLGAVFAFRSISQQLHSIGS